MAGEALEARIRFALRDHPAQREVRMFGGLSFMVDERMIVACRGSGSLLVHIDPLRSTELLSRPGARPAEMGKGRSMGPAWLEVGRETLTDEELAYWLQAALSAGRSGPSR